MFLNALSERVLAPRIRLGSGDARLATAAGGVQDGEDAGIALGLIDDFELLPAFCYTPHAKKALKAGLFALALLALVSPLQRLFSFLRSSPFQSFADAIEAGIKVLIWELITWIYMIYSNFKSLPGLVGKAVRQGAELNATTVGDAAEPISGSNSTDCEAKKQQ